jgi:alpha-tubulin suppressor-like RCC1 family protein
MANNVFFSCSDPDGVSNSYDIGKSFVRKKDLIENYPWLLGSRRGGSSLWLWGSGSCGELGNNSTINHSSPVQTVSAGTDWRCACAGGSTDRAWTIALKTNGTLWTWGVNCLGQLGDNTSINKSSPVQVIGNATNWKQITAGYDNSAAIKTDGTLWGWGIEVCGVLGNNLSANVRRSSPVQTISGGSNWKIIDIGSATAGSIKMDGTLWMWGCGSAGQLGNDNTVGISSPVQTVSGGTDWKTISTGQLVTGAMKNDSSIWTWGDAGFGRLGNDSSISIDRSSPVQVAGVNTDWKRISVGTAAMLALKKDGTLYGWGSSLCRVSARGAYCQCSPGKSFFDRKFIEIDANRSSAHGITESGELFSWGLNAFGSFGNLNYSVNLTAYESPVQTISGGNNWRSVSAGSYNRHVVAVRDTDDE